jgi:DNA-binding transcriptional ArsR family regulator
MDVEQFDDAAVSRIAAAIGEPARARMLYGLLDDRARTATELAMIAGVSPSTASAHLNRLRAEHLVRVQVQGKHRYYSLDGPDVSGVLESLNVLAGGSRTKFVPSTPNRLRGARRCYDHLAGTLGVQLYDRFTALGLLLPATTARADSCELTPKGIAAFESVGVDVDGARAARRRFAFACLDWSERRAHLGGAIGAAFLGVALKKKWILPRRDSRALELTTLGHRELARRFGLRAPSQPND